MPLSTSVAVRGYSVHPQCSAPGADVALGACFRGEAEPRSPHQQLGDLAAALAYRAD